MTHEAAAAGWLPALLIIYAVPYLMWRLARTDGVAPLAVVQIIIGLALGPGLLGKVAPGWSAVLFSDVTLEALGSIATLGAILFIWTAGVELDLGDLRAHARETGLAAGLAIAGPLLAGSVVAFFLVQHKGWAGAQAAPWQAMLGIGMACSVTALPILVIMMERLVILRTPLGRRVLRIASLDDVLLWGVLALILLDSTRLGYQCGFLAVFALCAFSMRRIIPRLSSEDRWPVALIWVAACAWGANWAELHYMVGAFLAGLVLDRAWLGEDKTDSFRDAVLFSLMPVFFLNTGLRTDWTSGGGAIIGVAALLLFVSVGGKVSGLLIAGRILGWRKSESFAIGMLLQTKALVMIIFSRILLDRAVISPAIFAALLLMAIASTVITIPAIRRLPLLRVLSL